MAEILSLILIVLGLALFEIIISVDNAIINAEVLGTMSPKGRKWFMLWGILIAVFLVRGLLPWLIVWGSNPSLGFLGSFSASFSNDPNIKEVIESSAPILLIGGGTFLVLLFFHWLFLEPKHYGIKGEEFFHKQGVWFFAVASLFLSVLVWQAIKIKPWMAFGAVIGSTAFFITHGFKENAEQAEKQMLEGSTMSDLSKIFYLEVIDATFSIDGILGAFAFTFMLPVILIGNGIGAIVVRQLTIGNIERVKKYRYLKNGAMYSILVLGAIMILDSFGINVPEFISPVATFAIVGYFFWRSAKALKVEEAAHS
ncbi:DUF475 domain-containing protein [Candidatus Woesearchaeota archaeon]|nr:DUF475 domain-containing protein [Candidatus Woesearchaeota archaeon]